ncbi:MAG TPA: hypothetical protein VFN07_02880 [Trueperaceae bacterium]|nr:hypothetical protein [Trueperaceae bacterium]
MHLVALVTEDSNLKHALRDFRDESGRFLIHAVPDGSMSDLVRALQRLDFAGAVILDEARQAEAKSVAARASLDASDLGVADTLTVTQAGVMADHTFGRALSTMLGARRWHADGAHAVILGAGPDARAAAREFARLGVASLAILASDRVTAERAKPEAAGTTVYARSLTDPLGNTLLARADLVLRLDKNARVDDSLLGPHLTVIDLIDTNVSDLRSRAIAVGALTFNRRDVEAHRFELALSQILGGTVGLEPLLTLFHGL